jgi:glucose uptake protein GlcU
MLVAGVILAVIGLFVILLTSQDRAGLAVLLLGVLLIVLGALLGADVNLNAD